MWRKEYYFLLDLKSTPYLKIFYEEKDYNCRDSMLIGYRSKMYPKWPNNWWTWRRLNKNYIKTIYPKSNPQKNRTHYNLNNKEMMSKGKVNDWVMI